MRKGGGPEEEVFQAAASNRGAAPPREAGSRRACHPGEGEGDPQADRKEKCEPPCLTAQPYLPTLWTLSNSASALTWLITARSSERRAEVRLFCA